VTDYEKQYQESRDVCGPPFQEFVTFFERYHETEARVLDLGCGQGRDALLVARMGHHVLGVDISRSGISQMLEEAAREALDVYGVVADIVEYEPSGDYDVVILDRVLHMLRDDTERRAVLQKASAVTKSGGYILIADTPKHQRLIRSFFESHSDDWLKATDEKGFIFVQRSQDLETVLGSANHSDHRHPTSPQRTSP
jgi:SAM-dependent methyltransferase